MAPGAARPLRPLRLVIAGSVDDGKSTLVGRLLVDTRSILADQHEAIAHASRHRGGSGAFDLALATDGLRAEREQGITIDVAYRYFATPRRTFILADTPGHVQYTRNTVTGASTADAAVILVDARNGVVEQTRRHAAVMRLLRVPHVVVAVNKMDAVDWSQQRFDEVATQVAGLGLDAPAVLPVSALTGAGVVGGGSDWYPGPALLPLLEALDSGPDPAARPFRLPVQLVIRPQTPELPDYRGLAGRVASGRLAVGDEVVGLPGGLRSTVTALDTPSGQVASVSAGGSVTVLLADDLDLGRGAVLADPVSRPPLRDELDGVLCWLADSEGAVGRRVLVKAGTAVVRGLIASVDGGWDFGTADWVPTGDAVRLNDLVRARVRLAEPVAADDYVRDRGTGGFLVIDPQSGATLAAGLVGDPLGGSPVSDGELAGALR